MVNKNPNLFIVGAPKCGTSFLYEHLATHPQVFMCPIKEPNYFDKDLHYVSPRLSLDQYNNLFKKAVSQKITGEASPWYLYSSIAARDIYQFNPNAKIIIMLRNPVDAMYSLYGEHLFQGNETEENFEKAIALEADRKKGINIPPNANPIEGIYYKSIVSYSEQVARYFDAFGRDNVLIIIFDDLKKNAEEVYIRTLQFLDIDSNFKKDLEVVNPGKITKNKALREFVLRPPQFFRRLIQFLIPVHSLRIYIQEKIISFNSKKNKRAPMNPVLAERLKKEMTADITTLGTLIGRDLTHWIK